MAVKLLACGLLFAVVFFVFQGGVAEEVGRRGRGFLATGTFSLSAGSNRAGNDESLLSETLDSAPLQPDDEDDNEIDDEHNDHGTKTAKKEAAATKAKAQAAMAAQRKAKASEKKSKAAARAAEIVAKVKKDLKTSTTRKEKEKAAKKKAAEKTAKKEKADKTASEKRVKASAAKKQEKEKVTKAMNKAAKAEVKKTVKLSKTPTKRKSTSSKAAHVSPHLFELLHGMPDPSCGTRRSCRTSARFKENVCHTNWWGWKEGKRLAKLKKLGKYPKRCRHCARDLQLYRRYNKMGLKKSNPTHHWNYCHWVSHKFGTGVELWALAKPISGIKGPIWQGHGPWGAPEFWGGTRQFEEFCPHAASGKYTWSLKKGLNRRAYDTVVGALTLTNRQVKAMSKHDKHSWPRGVGHGLRLSAKTIFPRFKTMSSSKHLTNPVKACKVQYTRRFVPDKRVTSKVSVVIGGISYAMKIMVKCKERTVATVCEQFPPGYRPQGQKATCQVARECAGVEWFQSPFTYGRGDSCVPNFRAYDKSAWPGKIAVDPKTRERSVKVWYKAVGATYVDASSGKKDLCYGHGCEREKICGCVGMAHKCVTKQHKLTSKTHPEIAKAVQGICAADCMS